MDSTELKKLLAGLSIVGLLTTSVLGGCATTAESSCTGKDKSGNSTEMQQNDSNMMQDDSNMKQNDSNMKESNTDGKSGSS